MEGDEVSLDPKDYPNNPNTMFYKTFRNYLTGALDCGDFYNGNVKTLPCYDFSDTSKVIRSLDGKSTVPSSIFDGGQLVFSDGTLLLFNNDGYGFLIHVDINGYTAPPNRLGYDVFTFQLLDGKITTMGDYGTKYTNTSYCNFTGSGNLNGIACAVKAKSNTDYFKELLKAVK